MGERVLVMGKGRATVPITDFLMSNDFYGPLGGVYYVDGNVSATGSGSPDHPYKTLAEAITASNTAIALSTNRWWARRNRIYCCGDTLTENLTAFPTKCDVIGCGSYDGFSKCGLAGRHVPASEAYGTRWYNMHFKAVAHASAIMTLNGASSVSGLEYHGCTFDATAGTVTSAILATASPFLKVIGCEMRGAFATSYVSFGTGEAGGAYIARNVMVDSAAIGIGLGSGTTASWRMVLDDNFIQATTLIVDDEADILYISNNDCVTAASLTNNAGIANAFDANIYRAVRNNVTGGDGINLNYPIVILV